MEVWSEFWGVLILEVLGLEILEAGGEVGGEDGAESGEGVVVVTVVDVVRGGGRFGARW